MNRKESDEFSENLKTKDPKEKRRKEKTRKRGRRAETSIASN